MKASTKAKLILTAVLCFASFTAGTAWREPPVRKEVMVEYRTPAKVVYVDRPVFGKVSDAKYLHAQANRLALAVPASALHPVPTKKPQQLAAR
jgi:hypothetical protein